jgi:hypothetical protein
MWSYEVDYEGKMRLGPSREKTNQVAELGNQICRCTSRKPQLLHIPCSHVIVVCYELQQFSYHRYMPWYYAKEIVQNIWTEQFRATSCRVLLLRTQKKMVYTYQIQILSSAKVLEDGRRGLGTTWTKQKLDLR